jgi:superfamily II DNA or RNA helicase
LPTDWVFATDALNLQGTGKYQIAPSASERQTVTAQAIVDQLRDHPGIVLADEVGMGKTYVALAVVASVLLSTRRSNDPVVVMVPPGLSGKWRREWRQFKAKCTVNGALQWMEGRDRVASSPTEFFKLLDGARDHRVRLVWLSTSCFEQGLNDGWMKLALVRMARRHTRMDDEGRKRLYKWATNLTKLRSKPGLSPDIVERLMLSDPLGWKEILVGSGVLTKDADNPIPEHLLRHADDSRLDWRPLVDVLRGEVPGRQGAVSSERLRDVRGAFNQECQRLYWSWLGCADWKASLLVLDEAHHAKNNTTKLAGLFRSRNMATLVEPDPEQRPMFWNKVQRMLFLTATPFQLGHHELIRVLRSFAAVRWTGGGAPAHAREHFCQALDTLETRLNENRLAGRHLDTLWGRLSSQHVGATDTAGAYDAVSRWWREDASTGEDPLRDALKQAVNECRRTKAAAERDNTHPWTGLQTWVIRHNRPTTLPHKGGPDIDRRRHRFGSAILSAGEDPGSDARAIGLGLSSAAALPFLLAARAQTELAMFSGRARAYFAEGLSSSYEAFHHTRDEKADVREGEEPNDDPILGSPEVNEETIVPLAWYEHHITSLVPSAAQPDACLDHPKIRAVVDRVVALWREGEKVLVFCFYRETAKALRNHLRREVDRATAGLTAKRLGWPEGKEDEAHDFLARVARRLSDGGSPFHDALTTMLTDEVKSFDGLAPWTETIVGALSAYVRSPSFIARYLPIDLPEVRGALAEGETRVDVIRPGIEALRRGYEQTRDGSDLTMRERVRSFLEFALELADRSSTKDSRDDDDEAASPLEQYLKAVTVYVDHDRPPPDEDITEEVASRRARSYRTLPTVRMVYGQTPRDVRERLMLAFNSPLFPEILVSSGVLSEGVDLHRFCRHLVHHDLSWNPSSMEQRTGRLDRIDCKAELCERPIVIYEPFVAGSADEKMFRVMHDRARWFQVVMGQKFELDEKSTETLASRVPLLPSLAKDLVFDLRRWRG